MNAIVSVTRDWGIGLQGRLLVANRADMRRFVELTCSGRRPADAAPGECLGTLVMGRKTLESFPGARPLPARRNIVLSRDLSFSPDGVETLRSKEQVLAAVADEDPNTVWLVGGEAVYRLLLDTCELAYVTRHETRLAADAFFPNLDEDPSWQLVSEEEAGVTEEGVCFTFALYKNLLYQPS